MEVNIVGYALMALIAVICYRIWKDSDTFQLKCIISDVDGKQYCVRERSKLSLAADRLAIVNKNMQAIVDSCKEKYPTRENVKRLVTGYNPQKIYETLPTSKFTAYSENKGEKIAFCLDTEKTGGSLIDENTLTFVATHELAHVASKTIGHNEEFWKNFKFLLEEAVELGVYEPVDYKNNNKRYCGMNITDNPYYDM
jgi:hypothetical protein